MSLKKKNQNQEVDKGRAIINREVFKKIKQDTRDIFIS